jgi:hypothetical protein
LELSEDSQFCNVSYEERTAAQESPLLEAVARERLMKIQQTGKRLCGYCGDV